MAYSVEEASELIRDFSRNQILLFVQVNNKGMSKKAIREEKKLIKELLASLIGRPPMDEEIEQAIIK